MNKSKSGKETSSPIDKAIVTGNEAACLGAVRAGCRHFFGYPITPQNAVTEWFAQELPAMGGRFVQAESEWSAAAMLFGAAAAGVRVMTSTSSPGWGLMQEVVSNIAGANLPVVIMDVQRGGPGQGSVQHAQMDYLSATRGAHGGYKNIVLAPNSAQETFELIQTAFYLADKYRNPTIILSDGIIGMMVESIEMHPMEFEPLPPKDWALRGFAKKGGKFDYVFGGYGTTPFYKQALTGYFNKYEAMKKAEVRYQAIEIDDADLVMVAFGYVSRTCIDVVNMARAEGLKVGLLRPITLWPFPYEAVRQRAARGAKFLVVEDNLGCMIEDVVMGVEGRAEVSSVNMLARHLDTGAGMILPDAVMQKVREMLSGRSQG
ncbi:MAG: 3-methyl-2-oxobutanoate dehydrogenase subunit VorB [Dehalococcoidia bacterium]|nr:3-methyl-2-oxobutanoate dehydrogenase subunit VorB [Dehalococcoidia bacterium]